jgi:mRNA interferase RelE/StbE
LPWKIELADTAQRQLEKLDKTIASRIAKFLRSRLAQLENPRSLGEALKGERFGELWKYRVGHSRLIAKIEDQQLLILVVTIWHRREVYR